MPNRWKTVKTDIWLGGAPRPGAAFSLLCLPYAGGGISLFRNWQEYFPPEIEVRAVQLPGHDARVLEKPFRNLSVLGEVLTEAVGPLLNKPFAIFGHSLGALLGYELACRLHNDRRLTPAGLIVSACRAPHRQPKYPPLHEYPDRILCELFNLDVGPGTGRGAVGRNPLKWFLPTLRADLEMLVSYTFRQTAILPVPIVAIGGKTDKWVEVDDLQAWRLRTSGEFKMTLLAGGHFYIRDGAETLVRLLRREVSAMAAKLEGAGAFPDSVGPVPTACSRDA